MLQEGHRRLERGTEVVVGLCACHGRPHTAALLDGLEVVPRRTVDYRGTRVDELDLDAVLARAPQVARGVDELAHTNAPGSRNEKRWQDIAELDAGIDMISTVNIQHLESLNDAVTAITGVVQRETVPDEVVRAADQIDLATCRPRRCAHGWHTATSTPRPRWTPHWPTTSGSATCRHFASSHCCGSPTRWTPDWRATGPPTASPASGRFASGGGGAQRRTRG